jgi:hypothetical protein
MTPQIRCENCDEPIHVEKRSVVGLLMACGCEGTVSIRTKVALPEEWSG